MILVTGGFGFIGKRLVERLNAEGYSKILILENELTSAKMMGSEKLVFSAIKDFNCVENLYREPIEAVFHLGAKSSTTITDAKLLNLHNYGFSKKIYDLCTTRQIPLIYASSAATYGDGEKGYSDETHPNDLFPLNLYGISKNSFDLHLASHAFMAEDSWTEIDVYGLKFFNVYGFGEFHKDNMTSPMFRGYHQLNKDGVMKLFNSYNPNYADGEQARDFVYVEDVVNVMIWFWKFRPASGLYNVGMGEATTFRQVAESMIRCMGGKIEIVDMPEHLREKYQYYTKADLTKLRKAGYVKPFTSIDDGIKDYIVKLNVFYNSLT